MHRLSLTLLALTACKGGSMKSPEKCTSETNELVEFLRATPKMSSPVVVGPGMQVKRTDLAPPASSMPPGPVLTIAADKLWFDGGLLKEDRVAESFMHARTHTGMTSYYLQIAPDVPWSRIVDIVKVAVELNYTDVSLAFEVTPAPLPSVPPRSAIDPKLDEIAKGEPGEQATGYARELDRILSGCKPAQKVFGTVSSGSDDPASAFIDGLAKALPECNCNVDMPSLRSALWRVMAHAPDVAVIKIDTSPGGDELALPATMPWSEANAKLTAGKHVTLSVAP